MGPEHRPPGRGPIGPDHRDRQAGTNPVRLAHRAARPLRPSRGVQWPHRNSISRSKHQVHRPWLPQFQTLDYDSCSTTVASTKVTDRHGSEFAVPGFVGSSRFPGQFDALRPGQLTHRSANPADRRELRFTDPIHPPARLVRRQRPNQLSLIEQHAMSGIVSGNFLRVTAVKLAIIDVS